MTKILNSTLWYIFLNYLHALEKGQNMFQQYAFAWITLGMHFQSLPNQWFIPLKLLSCCPSSPLDCYHLWKQSNFTQGPIVYSLENCIIILKETWTWAYAMILGSHSQKVSSAKSWTVFKIRIISRNIWSIKRKYSYSMNENSQFLVKSPNPSLRLEMILWFHPLLSWIF